MDGKIKKFVKERNEMLKKCDVNELKKFVNAHANCYDERFVNSINNASDEVLTITLHKMIVHIPKLPKPVRKKSAYWLLMHGFDLNVF